MIETALHWIVQYGYAGLFVLLMLGVVGLPVPDEWLLVFSGVLVERGEFRLFPAIAVAAAGSICGISLSYLLGRSAGDLLVRRFGRWLHLDGARLARVEAWYEKIGKWTLTVGYFIPGVRHLTAFTAGASRLPIALFALFAYSGALLWSATFLAVGYQVGERWRFIVERIHRFGLIALGAAAAALLIYLLARRLLRTAPSSDKGQHPMDHKKFDPSKLDRLNNPKRLERENPDLIWRTLDLLSPRLLVEIGAGTGFIALQFLRHLPVGSICACDISEPLLGWLAENLPEEARGRVIPMKMSETEVPLAGGIADLVYMVNLHHELEDPPGILGEALRLLRPGGKVAIVDWKKAPTPEGPPLEIRATAEEITAQLIDAGFTRVVAHQLLEHHHLVIGEKQ
jgi:membrane protein DedA with SNARE-associated domain/ubiquinone/menaquinone biosynthesis C-methylase UbiE